MLGWRIHWWTMPWIVDSPRPSWRDWRKASSRFGPTTPVAFARASVWHEEHWSVNFSLPLTMFDVLFSEQPEMTIAAATVPRISLPLSMGRHPNDPRGRAGRRLPYQADQAGSGRSPRSPWAAAITPRPTPSHE